LKSPIAPFLKIKKSCGNFNNISNEIVKTAVQDETAQMTKSAIKRSSNTVLQILKKNKKSTPNINMKNISKEKVETISGTSLKL